MLLISSYSWCLRDLRVQCLELYTASILTKYHWDKAVSFSRKISSSRQNNHWFSQTRSSLLKFSAQYSERGYGLWNLPTLSAAHITTIHDLFIYLFILFSNFFLTDPRSPIIDPRSSILDPDFPVNLEVMLIKIVLFFDHWSNQLFQSNLKLSKNRISGFYSETTRHLVVCVHHEWYVDL